MYKYLSAYYFREITWDFLTFRTWVTGAVAVPPISFGTTTFMGKYDVNQQSCALVRARLVRFLT